MSLVIKSEGIVVFKVVSLLLFTIYPLIIQAQTVYEFESGYSKAAKIGGKDFGDGYFFVKSESESSTYFYVINPALKLVDSYKTLDDVILLGIKSDSKEIRFYFTWNKTKDIHAISFLKANGKFGHYKKIAKDIEYITSAYDDDNFFIVILDDKNETLVVNKAIGDELTEISRIPIEDKKWVKFYKKNKFSFISEQSEVPFDSAANQNKTYLKDKNLIMISDNFGGEEVETTKIVTLNLKEAQIQLKTLLLPYDKTSHNSFLFKDRIYVLGIERLILSLNIYDFPSLNNLAELKYLKGQPIGFKASDLIENGRNLDQELRGHWSDETIIEQIRKSLNKGVPVIRVSSADSTNIRLTIGRNVPSKEPYRTVPTGTANGGTINVPTGKPNFPSVWDTGNDEKDRAYFYGYLDNTNFSLVQKKYEDHGSFDRANKRLKELGKDFTLGGAGVISSGNSVFLVFLNKKTKALTIEKI